MLINIQIVITGDSSMTKENLPNYYGSPSVDETIEVKPTYTEKKVIYKNKVWEEVHRLKKLYEKRKR